MGKNDIAETIQEHGQAPIDAALSAPVAERAQTPSPKTSMTTGRRINMQEVTPESVDWLWPYRIARGKFTLIDGDPGEGKSLLTLHIAACLSKGEPMPDEQTATYGPSKVLFLLCEDDLADTVAPRLIAAGADRSKIEVIRDLLKIPGQLDVIEAAIVEMGASLVIIDPLNGYIDGKINTHNDHQVRSALTPLVELAARRKVAIVGVRHLNKQVGGSAKYRGGGSIAYVGLARSALMVGIDPDDENGRILAASKGNLSTRAPSLRFAIVEGTDKQPRIEWRGRCDITADDLCAMPDPDASPGALADAKEFLCEFLSDGEKATKDVYQAAQEQKVSERTLRRAARDLGIARGKVWALPAARMKTAADVGASP